MTGLEQNIEQHESRNDITRAVRIIAGAAVAAYGLIDAIRISQGYESTFGTTIYNAPLPLIGPAAAVTLGIASMPEATRTRRTFLHPWWSHPIYGVAAGTAINAATSAFKWYCDKGQYAATSLSDTTQPIQFLKDMIASTLILGFVYAATAGVMNIKEWIGRRNRTPPQLPVEHVIQPPNRGPIQGVQVPPH